MTVKLILLKSGENIISNVKEGHYENKIVCYVLDNPCSIILNGSYDFPEKSEDFRTTISTTLTSWPYLSKDTTIELAPDWIITIVEPNDELKELYETKVLGIEKNEIS